MNEQGKFGSGKNTRRFRQIDGLLALTGKSTADGVSIEFPDGVVLTDKDSRINTKLSQALGQPVTLTREADISHFDDGSIHLLTASSLVKLQKLLPESMIDERRFRANIVIEDMPLVDDGSLIGKIISIGEVRLKVTHRTERCRMIDLEQKELRYSPKILKEVSDSFGLSFGVYASVLSPGTVNLGCGVEIANDKI